MIMIDSDVLIDYFRGFAKSKIFFRKLIESDTLFHVSVVSEAEILSGRDCEEKRNRESVELLLSYGKTLDVSSAIARKAGSIRRVTGIALDDCFIAASAMQHNLTLITRNLKDFSKVKSLRVKKPY